MTDDKFAEIDGLINQRLDLIAEQDKIKSRIADIDAALLPRMRAAGVRTRELYPGQGVTIKNPRRSFDDDRARATLTPVEYASICELKASSTLARKLLGADVADSLMAPGTGNPSISALGGTKP